MSDVLFYLFLGCIVVCGLTDIPGAIAARIRPNERALKLKLEALKVKQQIELDKQEHERKLLGL